MVILLEKCQCEGELDFVVEHEGRVLPIEVKSGKDYEKHSALDNVMAVAEYGIEEAYVFTNDNIKIDGKLTYCTLSIWSCFCKTIR